MRRRRAAVAAMSLLPLPVSGKALAAWAAVQPEHLRSFADTVHRAANAFGGDGPHPAAAVEMFAVAQHRIEEELS